MAWAPLNTKVVGYFRESDHNHLFEYSAATEPAPAGWEDYQHWVWVGPNSTERRWARVLKTRAYIVVDENSDGAPVTERWFFRSHTQYAGA